MNLERVGIRVGESRPGLAAICAVRAVLEAVCSHVAFLVIGIRFGLEAGEAKFGVASLATGEAWKVMAVLTLFLVGDVLFFVRARSLALTVAEYQVWGLAIAVVAGAPVLAFVSAALLIPALVYMTHERLESKSTENARLAFRAELQRVRKSLEAVLEGGKGVGKTAGPVACLLMALGLTGCGGGSVPVGPSAAQGLPRLAGNYTSAIDASSSCSKLSLKHFQWAVVATYGDDGPGALARATVTLPGGDAAINLTFAYALDPQGGAKGEGNLETVLANGVGVPIAGTAMHLATIASVFGSVSADPGGRGEVRSGSLDGGLELVPADASSSDEATEKCTAGDHRWSLRVR